MVKETTQADQIGQPAKLAFIYFSMFLYLSLQFQIHIVFRGFCFNRNIARTKKAYLLHYLFQYRMVYSFHNIFQNSSCLQAYRWRVLLRWLSCDDVFIFLQNQQKIRFWNIHDSPQHILHFIFSRLLPRFFLQHILI